MDGIHLRCNWGGEYENVAILVAIAVNEDGYREILGTAEGMKKATKKVEDRVEETLTYCDFPYEHRTRIHANNVIERLNQEIRCSTRVVGTFPDGNSALMLVCARLRHVASTQWGNKKYINIKHLEAALEDVSIAG